MSKRKIDKTKCTVIYQGQEADLDDKAAVTELLTPMFQEILGGKNPMKPEITVDGKKFTAMPFGEGGPMNTVKKNLLYQFTESELKKIGQEMAFTVGELEDLEQEKKDAMAGFKDRMEALSTRIKDAAHKINTGQEQRLIDCEVRKDFARNVVETFRLDTYGLVEERALTLEERQQELEFQAAKGPTGGKVEPSMLGATLGGGEPEKLRAVGGKKVDHPELV